jgi:hypothetical protein
VVECRGQQLALRGAAQQRVLGLRRHRHRDAAERPAPLRDGRELPARGPDQAGVAGLARVHGHLDGRQRLLDRHPRVEEGQLPEVDVVGAEPLQHRVEAVEQGSACRAVAERAPRQATAPGEDDVLPAHGRGERRAEHLLGGAVTVALGGLDEGAARVDERRELGGGDVDVGGGAPGHRAEPDV